MFNRLLQRLRYGEAVVVVSGLPRSGTSMLMNMLAAGGIPAETDGVRAADADNPYGYFELERVKNLEHEADKSYLRQSRGRAIKVISHLLKELPADNFYRVVFAVRDLGEVVASQNAMLKHRHEPNPVDDAKAIELYRRHLVNVRVLARTRPNFAMLEVSYAGTIDNPAAVAARVNAFLGGRLDERAMAGVVDPALYRNQVQEESRAVS